MSLEYLRQLCYIDDEGCWHWRGRCVTSTIASATVRTIRRKAVKLARGGNLPSTLRVTCACDSPADCINPAHARVETMATMKRRMQPQLRQDHRLRIQVAMRARGTKIDLASAQRIRQRLAAGESLRRIAADVQISREMVRKIGLGLVWRESSPLPT